MSDKKKLFTIVGLIIVIVFSFLMFFGANATEKTGIDTSAFIFTIVTEIITFGSIFFLISNCIFIY